MYLQQGSPVSDEVVGIDPRRALTEHPWGIVSIKPTRFRFPIPDYFGVIFRSGLGIFGPEKWLFLVFHRWAVRGNL